MTSKAIRNHISNCKKVAKPRPAYVDVSEASCFPSGRYVACGCDRTDNRTETYLLESDVKTAMSVDGHMKKCFHRPSLQFALSADQNDYVLIGKNYAEESRVDALFIW